MYAANKGHKGCIKALLDAGADKEAKDWVSSRDVSDAPLTADDDHSLVTSGWENSPNAGCYQGS